MGKETDRQKAQAEFRRQVEASPQFKAIQVEMRQAAKSAQANRQQKLDSNAEYQRRKAMSKDERAASAIDRMTQSIQTYTEQTTGKKLSHEAAKTEALRIARKALGNV